MTMDWIVTTGSTVDEALDVALDELAVSQDDIEFEILKEGRPSLFGFRKGLTQVRARVRPIEPPAKREWRRPPKSEKRRKSKKQTTAAKPKPKKIAPSKQPSGSKTRPNNKQQNRHQKSSGPAKEHNSGNDKQAAKPKKTRTRTINGSPEATNIRSTNAIVEPLSTEASKTRRTRKIDH